MAKQLSNEEIQAYKDKTPTDLQTRFADWLISKLGLEFANSKVEAGFREGVRLGTALRIPFQASDENQSAREDARAEREEAAAERKASKAPKTEPETKPAKATKAAKKAAPAPAEPDEEDEGDTAVAAAKPAKGPRKAARTGAKSPF